MAESRMTERLWGLALDIISLLTGETFPDGHVTITVSPPPSLTPERHALRKILEVTEKITDLIGEIGSSFELCLEVKTENKEEPVMGESGYSRVDGGRCPGVKRTKPFRVTPVRSLQREYEDASAAGEMRASSDEEEISHVIGADPGDALMSNVTPEEEEKVLVKIKEEEIPLQIGADGRYSQNKTEEHAAILSHGETEDGITTGGPTTPNSHSTLPPADLSSHPSIRSVCRTVFSPQLHCCSICGKYFPYKSALIIHERVHTGEKPYSCSDCGKCFSIKPHLTVHKRVHTGERPYSCSECGKCFSRTSQLSKHKRLHRGEKPYSCSVCGKCFSEKFNLMVHERVHTGEKPYSCSECGKRFPEKTSLNRHKTVHSGLKPFSCLECGKCFSFKSALTKHQKIHTR